MFHAYELEKAAPVKLVWFCHCHKCDRVLGPFTTAQKNNQQKIVMDAGWSYDEDSRSRDLCDVCNGSKGQRNEDEK